MRQPLEPGLADVRRTRHRDTGLNFGTVLRADARSCPPTMATAESAGDTLLLRRESLRMSFWSLPPSPVPGARPACRERTGTKATPPRAAAVMVTDVVGGSQSER